MYNCIRIFEKVDLNDLNSVLKAERDNNRKLMTLYQGEIRTLKTTRLVTSD